MTEHPYRDRYPDPAFTPYPDPAFAPFPDRAFDDVVTPGSAPAHDWFGAGPGDGRVDLGAAQRTTVSEDGTQTWTTTWTFTVTRTPGPAVGPAVGPGPRTAPVPLPGPVAHPVAQPAVPYPTTPRPPVGRHPDRALPAGRTVAVPPPVLTGPPDAGRSQAGRRPERAARTSPTRVPALLPVALCVAIGLGVVTAGIRSHALDRFGLRPTDNDTVVTEVLELFGKAEQD